MKKILSVVLISVNILIFILSLASLNVSAHATFFKYLDFPRIQVLIIITFLFLLSIFLNTKLKKGKYLSIVCLVLAAIIQFSFVKNYTSFVKQEIPSISSKDAKQTLSLLVYNVKMKNQNFEHFYSIINEHPADILLLMETDQLWKENLQFLKKNYPYFKEIPQDNTYGMLLYSKYALDNIQVEEVSNENVPTIHAEIELNDKKIHFFGIHPVPPKDFEDLPDNEGEKENMLIKLGRKIETISPKEPIIIAGDFNDVLWGRINPIAHTGNRLKDLRVGRRPIPTFNAKKFYMSWPLDHVITTDDFSMVAFEKLPSGGSDHNPIFVELNIND